MFFDRRGARDREPRDRPRPIAASTPRTLVTRRSPLDRVRGRCPRGWTSPARERPRSVAATLRFWRPNTREDRPEPKRRDASSSRLRRASRYTAATHLTAVPPRALQALEKYNIEKDIAAFIKKEFDKKYNPTWHCIVGRNFGSYVTHETKHFIYFYLGQVAVLLFKSG